MDIVGALFKVVFVAASVLPYYPQYAQISETKDASGFSSAVSGILIVANSLRIVFWLLEPFDLVLLAQSVAVIVGQGALLRLCVMYAPPSKHPREFSLSSPLTHWWDWASFSSYVSAWAFIVSIALVIAAVGGGSPLVVQGMGTAALGLEATMTVPQALRNAQRGSTAGLSTMLVGGWVVGDCVKMGTYLTSGAPWQFMGCGIVQTVTDSFILGQIAWYSSGQSPPLAPPAPDSAQE